VVLSTHYYPYKPHTLCRLLLIFPMWDNGVTTDLICIAFTKEEKISKGIKIINTYF
jgi:hypothetical protein